jgi:hypothetical protein
MLTNMTLGRTTRRPLNITSSLATLFTSSSPLGEDDGWLRQNHPQRLRDNREPSSLLIRLSALVMGTTNMRLHFTGVGQGGTMRNIEQVDLLRARVCVCGRKRPASIINDL